MAEPHRVLREGRQPSGQDREAEDLTAAEPGGLRIVYTARLRLAQVRAAINEAFDIIASHTSAVADVDL